MIWYKICFTYHIIERNRRNCYCCRTKTRRCTVTDALQFHLRKCGQKSTRNSQRNHICKKKHVLLAYANDVVILRSSKKGTIETTLELVAENMGLVINE